MENLALHCDLLASDHVYPECIEPATNRTAKEATLTS